MKATKRMNWVGLFGLVLVFVWIPTVVHADLGDFLAKFHPYAVAQEEYSNNVNLTHENTINDFITTAYAGLRFSTLPRPTIPVGVAPAIEEPSGIELDYRLGYVYYAKHTSYNYISQQGAVNAWYTFGQRLTVRARDYLTRSEEPRERDYATEAIEGEHLLGTNRGRPVYFRNVFEPSVEYHFGEENLVSINYRNTVYKNESHIYENSRENFINPRVVYWFNIRNGVSFQYGLTFGDFEHSPDLIGQAAIGRYTFRFNPRTSIFGEYAYLTRNFETPYVPTVEPIDYDIHRPSLGIEHAITPSLSGRLQVGYYWEVPETGPTASGVFYIAVLTKTGQRTTYSLSSRGGYTEDYFTAENLGFTKSYNVLGSITHQLLERLSVGASSGFQWSKDREKRIDRIWESSGNISYQLFDWLTLALIPSYRRNHSNDVDRDYIEYSGMFRITATY